mgnify:CR=1 FL=1
MNSHPYRRLKRKWMLCFLLTLFLIGTVSFTGCSFFPGGPGCSAGFSTERRKTWKRDPGISYSVPHGVPILMYHMIGNIKNNAAVMTADNFRWSDAVSEGQRLPSGHNAGIV